MEGEKDDTAWKKVILEALPENLQIIINKIPLSFAKSLEEIRIREERPLMIFSSGRSYCISKMGRLLFLLKVRILSPVRILKECCSVFPIIPYMP